MSKFTMPITQTAIATTTFKNTWALRITEGRIEVNESVSVDEAAKAVLAALSELLKTQMEHKYEQGFIDGVQKNTESKVTQFIDQNLRKPLTDEEMGAVYSSIYGAGTDRENLIEMGRAVERAHGIGEEK